MRQNPPKLRRPGLLAAAFAVALTALVCTLALPVTARAQTTDEEHGVVSVDDGDTFKYYDADNLQDAMNEAANTGHTLYLERTLNLNAPLYVPAGKKVTINFTVFDIHADHSTAFVVCEGGELVLMSTWGPNPCWYTGYNPETGKEEELEFEAKGRGLLNSKSGISSTIRCRANSTVTLDGIIIGGSYCGGASYTSDYGDAGDGVVSLAGGATLNMKNGASIEHCKATNGTGVCVTGTGATINLDASSITNNRAEHAGGGIRGAVNTTINLTNGSHIDNNYAPAGGGIYFLYTGFTLTGDGTGTVSGNKATGSSRTTAKEDQSGGGIHVVGDSNKDGGGLIENVTIANNYSAYDGGGIELDRTNTRVKNCVIKDNSCKYEGGGICVDDKGNSIEDCTITGNACDVDNWVSYEGGGVFVLSSYDIELKGVCVIKGNTRGKGTGNADDLFLNEGFGGFSKAYITGSLSKGSTVGVRTGITGDRRIAKNFKHETNDCLFIDLDGYYVSYGTDEGGDAWQRHTTKEFAAKINGEIKSRYKWGAAATLVAPLTKGDDQVFWYWDAESTSGLNPVGDYITEKNKFSNALAFTMPQNDVDAAAVYATRATKVLIGVDAPEAGETLPATARVRRADGKGSTKSFLAAVTWYEVDENGKKSDVAAGGVAKAGTEYVASVTCAPSAQGGLCFSKSFKADGVTVKTPASDGSAADGPAAESASVDAATGALTVVTKTFPKTEGEKPTAKDNTATVKMLDGGIAAGLATGASEAASIAALSGDEGEALSGDASLGGFTVSWAEDDKKVTITAPAKAGYNFCNWKGVPAGVEYDDTKGYVEIPVSAITDDFELAAVYTPAVTRVEVEMNEPAPSADHELATKVKAIVLTAVDGSTFNLVEMINQGERPVTWLPESENGKADFSTAYTALVELADGEGFEGLDDVLASGAQLLVTGANGTTEAEAAGFTVVDGKLCLAISFGETRAPKATGVTQPGAVEVAFEDAAAGNWSLPKTVEVTLENGDVAEGDVEWEAVEGFNAGATAAQELKVNGTITHVAYYEDVDADGLDHSVSVTVKVAAPKTDDADKDDDTTDDATKGDGTATETTTTTTKTAAKKGTPSTGDVTWGGFAGLLAVAVVCLVAARLSRRNN